VGLWQVPQGGGAASQPAVLESRCLAMNGRKKEPQTSTLPPKVGENKEGLRRAEWGPWVNRAEGD